jgi:co-chaperonin GroES (HSP10)
MTVKPNDYVVLPKMAGLPVKVKDGDDDKEYIIIHEKDIIAILK